jgi:outer membrane autotransporter protein
VNQNTTSAWFKTFTKYADFAIKALKGIGFSEAPGSVRTASLPEGFKGLSSGDGTNKHGLWFTGTWSDLDNDLSSTAYDGDAYLLMAGYDYAVADNFILGIAAGYDWVDIDTQFNNGNLESDGFTISPYGVILIGDSFSLDAMLAYSFLDYDVDRNNGNVTGAYDAHRFMAGVNFSYYYIQDALNLTAKIGYVYSTEESDAFIESDGTAVEDRDTDLGEFRIGGRVGYFFGNFEPYFSAYYLYDSTMEEIIVANNQEQPSNDEDEVEATLGFNYLATNNLSCGLEVSHGFFREDFSNTNVMFNLRYEF